MLSAIMAGAIVWRLLLTPVLVVAVFVVVGVELVQLLDGQLHFVVVAVPFAQELLTHQICQHVDRRLRSIFYGTKERAK